MIPVSIGLFGHVDHGKTELARALSEKVSTAGLDKHPEAKRRQMTIDLGFTAFTLGNYIVTLVDVPGHADLIRTAVSGASIIDAAILVVSAAQGPQIQTGEHLVLLDSLDIEKVVVALTYADLIRDEKLNAVRSSTRDVLSGSRYNNAEIVAVSSITGFGLPELKDALLSLLAPPSRDVTGKFKMVIDHSFPIKGTGTVVTGTVIRGKIGIGEYVEISPINASCRVKTIQTFKESRKEAQAGDRVGIALQGIDYRSIYRGYYVSSPKSLASTHHILVRAKTNRFFKHEITPGLLMHITVGMSSIQAEVFPYQVDENKKTVITSVNGERNFTSYVKLSKPVVAERGDRVLFSLLSLPPNSLRIAAGGIVSDILTRLPSLSVLEEKVGVVSRITQSSVIIGGLARSKIGAERMIGQSVFSEKGGKGIIRSAFGSKGLLVAQFDNPPTQGDKVSLKRYREFNISQRHV